MLTINVIATTAKSAMTVIDNLPTNFIINAPINTKTYA